VKIASRISLKEWVGHPLQFIGTSVAYPLLAGGAFGVLFERHAGYVLLSIGVALLLLADRRMWKL
jgi:hypothetical protein